MPQKEVKTMIKQYILIVRDKIITPKPNTDETLKQLNCYYQSPVFTAEENLTTIDFAIEKYHEHFKHFIDWSAELVEVQ